MTMVSKVVTDIRLFTEKKESVSRLQILLQELFMQYGKLDDDGKKQRAIYQKLLAQEDLEQVEKSIKRLRKESKFLPSIADIFEDSQFQRKLTEDRDWYEFREYFMNNCGSRNPLSISEDLVGIRNIIGEKIVQLADEKQLSILIHEVEKIWRLKYKMGELKGNSTATRLEQKVRSILSQCCNKELTVEELIDIDILTCSSCGEERARPKVKKNEKTA